MRDVLEELLNVTDEEDEGGVLEQLLRRAAVRGGSMTLAQRETAQQDAPDDTSQPKVRRERERKAEKTSLEKQDRPVQTVEAVEEPGETAQTEKNEPDDPGQRVRSREESRVHPTIPVREERLAQESRKVSRSVARAQAQAVQARGEDLGTRSGMRRQLSGADSVRRGSVWTGEVPAADAFWWDGDLSDAQVAGTALAQELSQSANASAALARQLEQSGRASARASSAAVSPVPSVREGTVIQREQTVGTVGSVKQVDRAFERDARRYDNPFYLY